MLGRRGDSRLFRRHRSSDPSARFKRKPIFEALEQRLLLSVTGAFDGAASLLAAADVNVSQLTGSQTETHIAANPAVPGSLVAMSNGGTLPNEFTAISTSSGQSWTTINLGPADDGLAGGDRFDRNA